MSKQPVQFIGAGLAVEWVIHCCWSGVQRKCWVSSLWSNLQVLQLQPLLWAHPSTAG
jgi:hypothetical protein